LEEFDDTQREVELLREKMKSLEKKLKDVKTPKMVEKSVETASGNAPPTDIVSPVMIHLVMFWILNTTFSSHLISIGVADSETMQGGVFIVNILYIIIVWYVMRAWNM
jgi:F0F1-type ATP synthase assembly protein I